MMMNEISDGLWLSVKWFVFSVADDENGRVLSRVKDWFANDR